MLWCYICACTSNKIIENLKFHLNLHFFRQSSNSKNLILNLGKEKRWLDWSTKRPDIPYWNILANLHKSNMAAELCWWLEVDRYVLNIRIQWQEMKWLFIAAVSGSLAFTYLLPNLLSCSFKAGIVDERSGIFLLSIRHVLDLWEVNVWRPGAVYRPRCLVNTSKPSWGLSEFLRTYDVWTITGYLHQLKHKFCLYRISVPVCEYLKKNVFNVGMQKQNADGIQRMANVAIWIWGFRLK